VDDPASGRSDAQAGGADRKRSRDVNDHMGWLIKLVSKWQSKGKLAQYERDELISIAFIEARSLLRDKYDPSKSTVTTFLSRFLYSRVHYWVMVQIGGYRKTPNGWVSVQNYDQPSAIVDPPPLKDREDLDGIIELIHTDLKSAAIRLSEGASLTDVVSEDRGVFAEWLDGAEYQIH
jgi:hypothetical protein